MWFLCKCGKLVFNNFKRFQEGVRCKNRNCVFDNNKINNWNSKSIEYTYESNFKDIYKFNKMI